MWRKYIGIPFKDKGRDETGLDCWGLVRMIYKDKKNIELESRASDYTDVMDKNTVSQTIKTESEKWIKVENPQPFDVVVFRILGAPMHVGLVTDANNMIHCESGSNSVIESFKSLKWQNRIMGFYRWKD